VPVGRFSRAPGPAAGFTLIEVVVTLGVLAVGMALASRLLIESQLGLVRTSAELGNPMPRYALARLRSDLEQATATPNVLPVWWSSPLLLTDAHGGRVAWLRTDEEDLERVVVDPSGEAVARHVVLRDVAEWRWREAAPRLLDVDLVYRARDTSRVPLADVARTWSPPTVERGVWMRVALRADGGAP